MLVGVTKAAGWSSLGEYLQGLSGRVGGAGVVHVAVTVLVVVVTCLVRDQDVFVFSLVEVVVTALGFTVLILFAVPLGTVTVESGPTVDTSVNVDVSVTMLVGFSVILMVSVGV